MNKGIKPEINNIDTKLKIYKEKFDKKMLIERLESMRKSWIMDIKGLIKGKLLDFESVKKEILEKF